MDTSACDLGVDGYGVEVRSRYELDGVQATSRRSSLLAEETHDLHSPSGSCNQSVLLDARGVAAVAGIVELLLSP